MKDIIIIIIIGIIIGLAAAFVYKSKKKGQKCIGCPYSCTCHGKTANGCCGYSKPTSSKNDS